jgi:S-adenosylmethionine:tRNA ribosyltransferase-isomerase
VQYAYLRHAIELGTVQTRFAGRPWAAEMPSAGRPLTWNTLLALRARGVGLAALTHAAGLSATGDPALDRALPLPERYDIPARTVAQVERARARGGTVVAVGTTVVRALEGNAHAHGGRLVAGTGMTDLIIAAGFVPRVVGGLLSGMHEPGTSHFRVLAAFDPTPTLARAAAHAAAGGYLVHEFGDSALVLPGAAAARLAAA